MTEELTRQELIDVLEVLQDQLLVETIKGSTKESIWKLERLRCRIFGLLNPAS